MFGILKKMFGSKHERDVRALRPLVDKINGIEEEYQSLSDEELRGKTQEFKKRFSEGETLDDLMCEAFATVKNTCRRLMGTTGDVCGHEILWEMVPFDVQLIGGIVLHQGKIAEMATGEGKTLVATMPLYLNALTGKNVQLVTTNDYLARRDAQWMGRVFEYHGLTVGCIQDQMNPSERREEYAKDITYGTNSQFGFDYLRDNGMAYDRKSQVQRDHYYAIIDEVDSILIDEARTPLIISGPAPSSSHQYFELRPKVDALVKKQRTLCNNIVREIKELLEKDENEQAQLKMYQLHNGMPKHKQWMHLLENPVVRKLHEQIDSAMLTDTRKEQARELREELFFTIDERGHDANLTEKGCDTLNPGDPNAYVLPDLVTEIADLELDTSLSEKDKAKEHLKRQNVFTEKSEMIHNVDQLIRAYCVYEKDVQYVIQGNQIMIVDEFTGRIMPGRRWSDGLHQAIEAKEGVKIERETQTLATITIQNYFRMYEKLAGMTGTAETEASEFHDIYKLDVVVIPTNRPIRRIDGNDLIYKTQREKFNAVIKSVKESRDRGQPVLLGTATVDTSELLGRMLKRANIPHTVLNAKNHESEAEIVTRAGQPGAVTIATNMAGRGTDIKLAEQVVHIKRDVITSQCSLDDKIDGATLRSILEERPCGLHVIGSERHESRRIDRQLRGRCARQGDPGVSRFFISLEDDLMRLFGSDRISGIMSRLGLEEGQELEHKWLNRSIETAQRRVEQQNFAIRKRTLEYDDVMNKQREIVYGLRGDVVRSDDVREYIYDIISDVVVKRVEELVSNNSDDNIRAFIEWIHLMFPVAVRFEDVKSKMGDMQSLSDDMFEKVKRSYDLKVEMEDGESVGEMERHIILSSIDSQWQDYLRGMDALRQGVNLRAYGQRDPLIEYKKEAFLMFGELMKGIYEDIASAIFRSTTSADSFESFLSALPQTQVHDEVSILGSGSGKGVSLLDSFGKRENENMQSQPSLVAHESDKVGRNDLCPCGSGKKFKKCCGK